VPYVYCNFYLNVFNLFMSFIIYGYELVRSLSIADIAVSNRVDGNGVRLFVFVVCCVGGPDSSVGIATDFGLDGPGSKPGGDEIFRPSRPALGPIQLPLQWVPGLSQW